MVRRLKDEGYWVRGVDLKQHQYLDLGADDFVVGDLRDPHVSRAVTDRPFDEVYQLAADMGGAGFIFTGDNDASVMHNSALINLNMIEAAHAIGVKQIFYSSSACMYPEHVQMEPDNPGLKEDMAYPAAPDSEYGWEKLFSERLYLAFARNYGMNVRIARFHNIYGPFGSWSDGREKAPAAMCRKIAEAPDGGVIEMWGDGEQTRSFLYVNDCIEGVRRLMSSDFTGPVNIGSEEMVSINQLAKFVMEVAGKTQSIHHIPGPQGVRGRNSNNDLVREKLSWEPAYDLRAGLEQTYPWIAEQVDKRAAVGVR
jgi:GDP-D-mannose 3', 5'-epimerase